VAHHYRRRIEDQFAAADLEVLEKPEPELLRGLDERHFRRQ
jgi:hypothetical protein